MSSTMDLLTDVYVTYTFGVDGKVGYFVASLASLSASMAFQLGFLFLNYRQCGARRILKECLPTLVGFKPAVDAYRVASGKKQEPGQAVNPIIEMTCTRMIEMFAEGIPGTIIQLMAILTNDGTVAILAWVSLFTSLLSTGFISASISYDFDTHPKKRKSDPTFYGYAPARASKRTIVFISMVFFSSGMLLIRSFVVVLLGLLGMKWAFGYIFADFSLFLLVKVTRRDFHYWIPVGVDIYHAILR